MPRKRKILFEEWQTIKLEENGRGEFSKFYHLKRSDGSLWYAVKSDEYEKTLSHLLSLLQEIQEGMNKTSTSSNQTESPNLLRSNEEKDTIVYCTRCGTKDIDGKHNYCGRCGERLRFW